MCIIKAIATSIGRGLLPLIENFGGLTIFTINIIKRLFPPKIDYYEFKNSLYSAANRSLLIVIVTALLTGAIGVIQAAYLVKRYQAFGLVGGGAGFIVVRELGPVLIALMFSGRVGSNITAELGTMVVTEQIDALRILAIDPIQHLIIPRVISMIISIFCLTLYGDIVALIGGAITSQFMLGVDYNIYIKGILEWVKLWDFITGIIKAFFFGIIIGVISCYFGMKVKGGAPGVGKAVNSTVVINAASIFLMDYIITYILEYLYRCG